MRVVTALFCLAGMFAGHATVAADLQNTEAFTESGSEIRLYRTQYFHLKSKVNGRVYRIMIAAAKVPAPSAPAPTLYVLDGGQYFETAAIGAVRYAYGGEITSPIVVGIGHATDDIPEMLADRAFDFTPSPSTNPAAKGRYGGGPSFATVLETEIIPFVRARHAPDLQRQAIWGHSYGSLFVMANMMRNPAQFTHYVLSSPSIWWNGREVLKARDSFARLLAARPTPLSVLVTSAGEEQYRGTDPARLAADENKMVDNATDFAKWMADLNLTNVKVQRVVFEGEGHSSAAPVSVNRALRFAFPR